MKAIHAKNHKVERPRSIAKVLIVSGLYAVLMGSAAYFTYTLLLNPARERNLPAIPKRTEVPPDPLLTLITAAHLRATRG